MKLAVCRYEELGPQGMAFAREVYPRHSAFAHQFGAEGGLLMIGTFDGEPGAMGVFRDRAAAERFVDGDPFITEGVIARWSILDWNADVYGQAEPTQS